MRFLCPSATGSLLASLSLLFHGANSITLDITSTDSIKTAASDIAYDMVSFYHGNETGQIPGVLPGPYYWWECGAMLGSLINYWYYTNDSTYNDLVIQALQFQVGPQLNFQPPNQTQDEGNDDQLFWAFSAMAAAELGFPNPAADQPGWLALAQGVFNTQTGRWETSFCGGGMRWQFNPTSAGYTYKNTPSNGGYFNLATRLGAYTGNATFFEKAERTWDWLYETVGLIGKDFDVYDGTEITDNCTSLDHTRWSYTQAFILNGAAVMYYATNNSIWNGSKYTPDVWKSRTQGLWNASSFFFTDAKVMQEGCEPVQKCDLDQQSFKAYLARYMAASMKYAPFLVDEMEPYLQASAQAAAEQCDGGANGRMCGLEWTMGSKFDGNMGVGEEMAALEVIQSLLIKNSKTPVTSSTGGTSQGDNDAGTTPDSSGPPLAPITTGDKAGAGILTAMALAGALSGTWWLVA